MQRRLGMGPGWEPAQGRLELELETRRLGGLGWLQQVPVLAHETPERIWMRETHERPQRGRQQHETHERALQCEMNERCEMTELS
jgi:hypothetical protein